MKIEINLSIILNKNINYSCYKHLNTVQKMLFKTTNFYYTIILYDFFNEKLLIFKRIH